MKRYYVMAAMLALVPATVSADSFQINIRPASDRIATDVGVTDGITTYDPGRIYIGQESLYDTNWQLLFPIAYCVDLKEWAMSGTWAHIDPLSTLGAAGNPSNPPDVNTGSGPKIAWLLNSFAFDVASANEAAGLQLAIWEVEYERGANFGVGSGNFLALGGNTAAMQFANGFLAGLGGNTSEGTWIDVESANQDFGVPAPPVPEPASLLLLSTGLIGARFARRRRKK